MHMLYFMSGAMMMGAWIIALFFYRFGKRTRDSFFYMFSIAFGLIGIERWVLAFIGASVESRPYVYSIRLLAFVTILGAIIQKNRGERQVESPLSLEFDEQSL